MKRFREFAGKLPNSAFVPVDIASLVFFRIAFGLIMLWQVLRFFALDRIAIYWLEPRFLFKLYGFSWVHPWPGNWLYIHWAALGLFALFECDLRAIRRTQRGGCNGQIARSSRTDRPPMSAMR